MNFASSDFIVFFIILLVLYWLRPRAKWQNTLLLAASYLFYGWIHPWYALLLGISTLIDYGLSRLILTLPSKRRTWLFISLIANLGVLGFFKYNNFFMSEISNAASLLGIDDASIFARLILPAGLSFYTLKKISFILDISRGNLKPPVNFLYFSLYVSFFPQIVAGPIDRAQKLIPQMERDRIWSSKWFHSAWPLLITGLFKKFVIADTLKVMVDRIYNAGDPSKLLILSATLAFSIQILADFSAYTDLARGIASLLGFETSENFQQPYLSITPTEFWNRWHMTLSSWLRDYLFFPLRRAILRLKSMPVWISVVIPPLFTMAICGLWHGSGWTYLLWGLFHGILIAAYQLVGLGGSWKPGSRLKILLAWVVMFCFTLLGWVLFRAPSVGWLGTILFYAPWLGGKSDLVICLITVAMTLIYSLPLILFIYIPRIRGRYEWLLGGVYALLLAAVVVYLNPAPPDFIYFQF